MRNLQKIPQKKCGNQEIRKNTKSGGGGAVLFLSSTFVFSGLR
jgi:hypothetical protein